MIGLLDTSILIASGDTEPLPDLAGFTDLRVSTLTWAELIKGSHATTNLATYKRRAARLAALRTTFGAGVAFDDACADAYDRVLAHVTDAGGSPRSHVIDRMLAATALAHDLVLVTRDKTPLRDLSELVAVEER